MSQYLGANTGPGASGQLVPLDECIMPKWHRWNCGQFDQIQIMPWQPGVLWSGSGFCGMGGIGQGTFGLFSDDSSGYHSVWDVDVASTGGQQAKKFIGTTRDNAGNPLANCNVEGFITATNVSIGIVQSDTSGYFELPSSAGAVAHFLVSYKAGSPDVAGTTKNNLVPV